MTKAKLQSINPKNNVINAEYEVDSANTVEKKLDKAHEAFLQWREKTITERAKLLKKVAKILLKQKNEFAQLMQDEMGKLLTEAKSEIEKCADLCEFYADNAESFLADDKIKTDLKNSFVTYQPIGVVYAIMPWNFPFWQVFRFAVPNLMAGNVGILKHAENVTGCSVAIENIFKEAGYPEGCFTSLFVKSSNATEIVANENVRAVTLTGSAAAGKSVAAKAGECLKKSVLELGGSDAYVILADADIDLAAKVCAQGRLLNAGQTCIAAKRFIVATEVLDEFTEKFKKHMVSTNIAVMARKDLQEDLHKQVKKSIKQGAKLLIGGEPSKENTYYPPTILTNVKPGMVAFDEELFGPVAAIIEAKTEDEAFALANKSAFGLGGAIFSKNEKRATELARTKIDTGNCAVNSFVKSNPRLPFGGVKESGYGRELGKFGIHEFVNIKTITIE